MLILGSMEPLIVTFSVTLILEPPPGSATAGEATLTRESASGVVVRWGGKLYIISLRLCVINQKPISAHFFDKKFGGLKNSY